MPINVSTIHSSTNKIRTIATDTYCRHHHDLHTISSVTCIADDHIKSHRRQSSRRSTSGHSADTETPADIMQKPVQPIMKSTEEDAESSSDKGQLHVQQSNSMSSDESDSSDETAQSSRTTTSKQRQKIISEGVRMDSPSPNKIRLKDVGPYDVLSGRDKAVFNHVGNRRFRVSLALWIPRYDEAQTKSEKAAVIGTLCHMLKNEAGIRFLKKYDGGPGEEGFYMELNTTQTKKKVGHAIRDMSVARKEVSQRRSSARKAKRARKLGTSSQDYSSSSDDDASTSSHLTDSILSDSLTALLPFVSNDPHGGNCASMEPLPFDGVAQDSERIIVSAFVPEAAMSVMPSMHPPTSTPNTSSTMHFSASSSSIQPSIPTPSHLLRSNSFSVPPSHYHVNHYHYHQYQQPNQASCLMPGISSPFGEKEGLSGHQQQQWQTQQHRQRLYHDSSMIDGTSSNSQATQFFESTDSSEQQQKPGELGPSADTFL
jgi:hypothetical protein